MKDKGKKGSKQYKLQHGIDRKPVSSKSLDNKSAWTKIYMRSVPKQILAVNIQIWQEAWWYIKKKENKKKIAPLY